MEVQKKTRSNTIITETRWIGGRCIKARSAVNKVTGKREVEFKKWVNGRFIPGQHKLMPGYWAEIKFYELDLRKKITNAFAHMLPAGG